MSAGDMVKCFWPPRRYSLDQICGGRMSRSATEKFAATGSFANLGGGLAMRSNNISSNYARLKAQAAGIIMT